MLKEESLQTHTHTHSLSHTFLSPLTDRRIDRRRLCCFIFLFSNDSAVDSSAEIHSNQSRQGPSTGSPRPIRCSVFQMRHTNSLSHTLLLPVLLFLLSLQSAYPSVVTNKHSDKTILWLPASTQQSSLKSSVPAVL